jgi:hypothetical protein
MPRLKQPSASPRAVGIWRLRGLALVLLVGAIFLLVLSQQRMDPWEIVKSGQIKEWMPEAEVEALLGKPTWRKDWEKGSEIDVKLEVRSCRGYDDADGEGAVVWYDKDGTVVTAFVQQQQRTRKGKLWYQRVAVAQAAWKRVRKSLGW